MAIRIETLGGLRAFNGAAELDWLHAQRLRAALITYLAVERTASRATLATLFWPESDEENARHALRQNLFQVKQVLGRDWVDARAHELRVTDAVVTDVAEFEAALARDDCETAARLYRGPFLDGVHVADLKPWESWVDTRRAQLTRDFRRACRKWVESCHAHGDAMGAIVAAQHWIAPDPLDDEGQHALIAALAASGRRTDALRQYETYAKLLEADGLEPLEETKELVEGLGREGEGRAVVTISSEAHGGAAHVYGRISDSPLIEVTPARSGTASIRRRRWLRRGATLTGVLGIAVVLTATLLSGEDLDADVYLVATESASADAASTELFRRHVDAALRRMPDARAPDPTRVLAMNEADGVPEGEGAWVRRARRVGAGRLLRISAMPNGGALSFEGVLYDVRSRDHMREFVAQPSTNEPAEIAAAAVSMVEHLFDLPDGVIARAGSPNDAAVRAFVAGIEAEQAWELDEAEAQYRQAISLDNDFARAHYRLAQILEWTGAPNAEWRPHVLRAVAGEASLDSEEALLAQALMALAERRFIDACHLYSTVLAVDAFSFRAQFGLGTCHRDDAAVVRDSTSPSGWSFRSSHHASVEAYERAFELEPGLVFTFGGDPARLSAVLYARPTQAREGSAVAPDTGEFAAFPSMGAADTLEFVPYRRDEIRSARAPDPPGVHEAEESGKRRLLAVVARLVREYADNPAAMIARAEALEAVHALDDVSDELSALAWAGRARRISTTPAEQVDAVLVEVRVLLKLQRYTEARRIALRAIDDFGDDREVAPGNLAALGALTGRSSVVAAAMERGASELLEGTRYEGVPVNILRVRERLNAFAMLGAWPDSVRALAEELERQATTYMDPSVLAERRCALMSQPLDYAYPVLRRPMEDPRCWTGAQRREAQWALHTGDHRRVAAVMDALDLVRQDIPPDRLAIDVAFTEAWLIMEAGDASRAAARLDASLGVVEMMDPARLRQPAQVAGLIRAMALRADIAAAAGDADTVERWAPAVAELWRDADAPSLRETAERMRALARGR